jgi:predicted enzyme related to lactoylglutathione lyase
MKLVTGALTAFLVGAASVVIAEESGIRVRSIRVLATDPDSIATFYQKAFGMSETSRPVNTPTFKEIIINSGSTPELAKKANSTPIVIATRGKDAPAGAMAALILQVPNLEQAIESAKSAGATVLRPPSKTKDGLGFAFLKDPDGNQIELVLGQR